MMMNQTPNRDLIYGTGDELTVPVDAGLSRAVKVPSVTVTSTDNFDVVQSVLSAMCRAGEGLEGREMVVVAFASSPPDRSPEIAFFLGIPFCLVMPLRNVRVLPKSLVGLLSSPSITKLSSGVYQQELIGFTNRYATRGGWCWASLFELEDDWKTRVVDELGCQPLRGMPRAADWDSDEAFIPNAVDEMLKTRVLAASVRMKEINHADLIYQGIPQRFLNIRQHDPEPNPSWADQAELVEEREAERIRTEKEKAVRGAPLPAASKRPPHRQAWITPDKGLCCLICDRLIPKSPSAIQEHMSSEEHFLRQVMKYAKAQIKLHDGPVGNDGREAAREEVGTDTALECTDCGRSVNLKDAEFHMMNPRHLYMLAMGRLTSYRIKNN
jgi:hypothetical protein